VFFNSQTVCDKDREIYKLNRFSLAALKTLLGGVAEVIKIRGVINHDTGKSCFEGDFKISVKK
jgi:hypothetical protein